MAQFHYPAVLDNRAENHEAQDIAKRALSGQKGAQSLSKHDPLASACFSHPITCQSRNDTSIPTGLPNYLDLMS